MMGFWGFGFLGLGERESWVLVPAPPRHLRQRAAGRRHSEGIGVEGIRRKESVGTRFAITLRERIKRPQYLGRCGWGVGWGGWAMVGREFWNKGNQTTRCNTLRIINIFNILFQVLGWVYTYPFRVCPLLSESRGARCISGLWRAMLEGK